MELSDLIIDDRHQARFKVHRSAFVSDDVLALERERVFGKCWLYLGHTSELKKPGDFISRRVGGRPLLYTRDRDNKLNALYNTCSHRGAMVCRERSGNRRAFTCGYHAWTFDEKGRFIGMPGREALPPDATDNCKLDLVHVERMEEFQRLRLRLLRQERDVAARLSRRRRRVSRICRRPGSRRHGDRDRHAGLLRRRQLEAAAGELGRRLSRRADPLDLLRLHPLARQRDLHQHELPGLGEEPRQRPCRVRVDRPAAVGPSLCALGAGLGRSGQGRSRGAEQGDHGAARAGARQRGRQRRPQPADLPQPRGQRRDGDHRAHLLSGAARPHGSQRLVHRAGRRKRDLARPPPAQLRRVPGTGRLRHARRRRDARALPARLRQHGVGALQRPVARHAEQRARPRPTSCRCAPSGGAGISWYRTIRRSS